MFDSMKQFPKAEGLLMLDRMRIEGAGNSENEDGKDVGMDMTGLPSDSDPPAFLGTGEI